MWDRKIVKARGKAAFQENYWRCVLVALIALLLFGGSAASGRDKAKDALDEQKKIETEIKDVKSWKDMEALFSRYTGVSQKHSGTVLKVILGAVAGVLAMGSLLKILVFNPLRVGCCQFFLRNVDSPAALGELGRAFNPAWGHNVVVLLLHDLFIVMWSLLFVIPGVIMAYAYRMTPYIQAEYPELSGTQAIKLSKQMMRGHKWNSFVYDLSYLGWWILSGLTAGLFGVLFVNPYKEAADAELYRAISGPFYQDQNAAF